MAKVVRERCDPRGNFLAKLARSKFLTRHQMLSDYQKTTWQARRKTLNLLWQEAIRNFKRSDEQGVCADSVLKWAAILGPEGWKEYLDDLVLPSMDNDPTSLQWRMLSFGVEQKWIEEPKSLLAEARKSAQTALVTERTRFFLGERSMSKKKDPFSQGLKDWEWALFRQLLTNSFQHPFCAEDAASLMHEKLSREEGKPLFDFLFDQWEILHGIHKKDRTNQFLQILCFSWTNPDYPVWMLSASDMKPLVEKVMRDQNVHDFPTKDIKTINRLIERAGLKRIPKKFCTSLSSTKLNPEGQKLQKDLKEMRIFFASNTRASTIRTPKKDA